VGKADATRYIELYVGLYDEEKQKILSVITGFDVISPKEKHDVSRLSIKSRVNLV